MVIVLEEISKIHIAIEKELVEYLGLWFDPSNMHNATKAQEGRKILLDLEGDKIKVRIGKARGSCKTIMNIYNTYLTPWFGRVLDKNEIEVMRILFESLHEFDGVMIETMEKLAAWLGPKATETLEMVDDDMNDKANDLIRSARREVLPIRQRISVSLSEIYKLQEDFIGKSGSFRYDLIKRVKPGQFSGSIYIKANFLLIVSYNPLFLKHQNKCLSTHKIQNS